MKKKSLTKVSSLEKHGLYPYILLTPALIVMICVVFIPIIDAFISSLKNYDLRYPHKTAWIGFANYVKILTKDPQFWPSFVRTLKWVIFGVGGQFVFGFLLALLLNQAFRGRGVVRAVSMIPWVTPGVLIGLVWRWLYDGDFGVVNDLLLRLGIISESIPYLARTTTALPATIITVIWQGIPFFALMLLAAMQGVSSSIYEAADIDGANSIQKLFRITLPSIKNTIYVTLLLRVIWVTNSVDIIQNMTAGGPAYATQTIAVAVYQQANVLNLGYASAVAIIMTLLMLCVAIPYLKSTFKGNG